MKKPLSKVVTYIDDTKFCVSTVKSLNAVSKSQINPLGITFVAVSCVEDFIHIFHNDGDVQAIITDQIDEKFVRSINQYRPEVCLYLVATDTHNLDVIAQMADEYIDGYFYRAELDFHDWFTIIQAQLKEKSETPFFTSLQDYVLQGNDSWHTPGHSSGYSLRNSPWADPFYRFFGENVFYADLSVSVGLLDSLMEPHSVIAKAQNIAAKSFGAKRTFFVTNGTSSSNKVVLQTLLAPGEKILLDRNSHKSAHHAVVLSGAYPIYLNSTINERYGIFGPVLKETIYTAIVKNPDAKLLLLTSCTYDGLRYDLRPIIEFAHEHGLKVMIDEAWYGHARFHPTLRPTALECGADYVCQSTHKMMSAFSQAAMIHVNDRDFNEHIFRENYNMHTSTSPQYNLIASLDASRAQMDMEGFKLLSKSLALAEELKNRINAIEHLTVLDLASLIPDAAKDENVTLDPTKVTVDISQTGYTIEELQQTLLNDHNIQIEKSTFNTISLLVTIGTNKAKILRLCDALTRIVKQSKGIGRRYTLPKLPSFTSLACLPRDAYYQEGELMFVIGEDDNINPNLEGRVCADQIVPYPPGIPILVPGQVISKEIISYLATILRSQKNIEIHGIQHDGYLPCLRVLTQQETASEY